MTDILTSIVAHKRTEVAQRRERLPLAALEREALQAPAPRGGMRRSLAQSASGIIAEFKRRSPSKDWIKREADASVIPPAYEKAGASALSVLTDEHFFGGSLDDLRTARRLVTRPLLRKDFIIDEYQLLEARCAGADAVLLIAACLNHRREYAPLLRLAHDLGLEVLLEIHDERELDYADEGPDMIGVNNRHLGTFHTDVETSFRLIDRLPADALLVSESGISSPAVIRRLRQVGYRGFLCGECFMREADPGTALQEFITALEP